MNEKKVQTKVTPKTRLLYVLYNPFTMFLILMLLIMSEGYAAQPPQNPKDAKKKK